MTTPAITLLIPMSTRKYGGSPRCTTTRSVHILRCAALLCAAGEHPPGHGLAEARLPRRVRRRGLRRADRSSSGPLRSCGRSGHGCRFPDRCRAAHRAGQVFAGSSMPVLRGAGHARRSPPQPRQDTSECLSSSTGATLKNRGTADHSATAPQRERQDHARTRSGRDLRCDPQWRSGWGASAAAATVRTGRRRASGFQGRPVHRARAFSTRCRPIPESGRETPCVNRALHAG